MNSVPPQNQNSASVEAVSKSTPVLGILSIVFGGLSLLPFLGVISPVGLVIGIFSLVKKQKITGVIGTALSGIGIATSPILWAAVICSVNPSAELCNPKPVDKHAEVEESLDELKKITEDLNKKAEKLNSLKEVSKEVSEQAQDIKRFDQQQRDYEAVMVEFKALEKLVEGSPEYNAQLEKANRMSSEYNTKYPKPQPSQTPPQEKK